MLQFKQSMRPTGSHLEHQRPHQHSRAHLVWNRCDCAGVSQRRNRVTGIRCHKATVIVIVHANCRVKSQNRLETSFPKAHFEGGNWGGSVLPGKRTGFPSARNRTSHYLVVAFEIAPGITPRETGLEVHTPRNHRAFTTPPRDVAVEAATSWSLPQVRHLHTTNKRHPHFTLRTIGHV